MAHDNLTAVLRDRVRQAEEKYTHASAAAAKVEKEYIPHTPDDHLQQALLVVNGARQEYLRVLHILTQLLVAAEIPEKK